MANPEFFSCDNAKPFRSVKISIKSDMITAIALNCKISPSRNANEKNFSCQNDTTICGVQISSISVIEDDQSIEAINNLRFICC